MAKTGPKLVRLFRRILFSNMASNPYFSLAVLFVAALGFGLAPLGLARLWGMVYSPAKPNAIKNAIRVAAEFIECQFNEHLVEETRKFHDKVQQNTFAQPPIEAAS